MASPIAHQLLAELGLEGVQTPEFIQEALDKLGITSPAVDPLEVIHQWALDRLGVVTVDNADLADLSTRLDVNGVELVVTEVSA